MEEAQRLLNPWVLHFQKLGLELKCPLCLQLFNRPMLLPCNHIFCDLCVPKSAQVGLECPACKHRYEDREMKPAPFMENIVAIYRNLDSTFNATLHPICSDAGQVSIQCPALPERNANNASRKEHVETAQEGNSSNGQLETVKQAIPTLLNGSAEGLVSINFDKCTTPESCLKQEFAVVSGGDKPNLSMADKHSEAGVEGVGFIPLEQLSPPLSSDSKDTDGNFNTPSNSHENAVKRAAKRPLEDGIHRTNLALKNRCTSGAKCHTTDVKRQKIVDTASHESEANFKKSHSVQQSSVVLDPLSSKRSPCVFCHSSKQTEGSGPLLSYANGKEVVGNVANFSKVMNVHEKCITWAPRIYFEGGIIRNLDSEVARASKLKCSSCGKKGAGLGCYMKSCPRTYHVPCAYDILDCRWECDDFLLLCPKHASLSFPSEKKSKPRKQAAEKRISTPLNPCTASSNEGRNLVFCGSALSSDERCYLAGFARTHGSTVSRYWSPDVTHVIAATDSNGACTRTLKLLMAILNGKWILTTEWVKACVEAGCLVNEEPYEVKLDNHGCSGGPKAGRLRVLNNAPKLFNNLKFHLTGDFVEAFKKDLMNLVSTAGGTIVDDPDQLSASGNGVEAPTTLVVYNTDFSDCCGIEDEDSVKHRRLAAAEAAARATGSRVVGHTWILESIAGCSLLPMTSRT